MTFVVLEPLLGYYGSQIFDSSKGLFTKVWDVINEKNPDVIELTNGMDINSKLLLIESIIRDIYEDIKIQKLLPTKSLELGISQMNEIIHQLHDNLVELKNKIDYHKTIWFHSLRTPEYLSTLETIKINKTILDNRFDTLIKIISLSRNEHNNIKNETTNN